MATSPAINGALTSKRAAPAPATATTLEARIAFFTARQLHLNPRKITAGARLREDLGLTDDDALQFFEAYAEEFHVDLDALFSRYWARHFGPFGIGWGTLVLMFLTASSAGFLFGFGASAEAWLLWASLTLLELVVMQGYPFMAPELSLIPITVGDLVRGARRGFWYEPSSSAHSRRARSHRRKDPASFGPILVRESRSA